MWEGVLCVRLFLLWNIFLIFSMHFFRNLGFVPLPRVFFLVTKSP